MRFKKQYVLTTLQLLLGFLCLGIEQPLRIVEASVQAAEDGPVAGSAYAFMPGDSIYCSFRFAGYQAEQTTDGKKLKMSYKVRLTDKAGVMLAPEESGSVEDELSEEDRDWYPKRRAVFQLPTYITAGDATLTISVTDLIAHTTASKILPLRLGGESLVDSGTLGIQSFHFYRSENSREALELAAYRPGDTVWARFFITGFKAGAKNRHDVQYGLRVLGPDGRTLLTQEPAAEDEKESFYPPRYVPGSLSLPTNADMITGLYTIVLDVRDLLGKKTSTGKYEFTLE